MAALTETLTAQAPNAQMAPNPPTLVRPGVVVSFAALLSARSRQGACPFRRGQTSIQAARRAEGLRVSRCINRS